MKIHKFGLKKIHSYLFVRKNGIGLSKFESILFSLVPKIILKPFVLKSKRFLFFRHSKGTNTPVTFEMWYDQLFVLKRGDIYWPVHKTSTVGDPRKIYCGIESCPGYSPGNYIQTAGSIFIGNYTQIAPNVGIISGNHDLYDNRKHIIKDVRIGSYCWIGMGAIILPGVELGDFTIVGAGAVVSKSFPEGYCIIAGNPAKIVRSLDKAACIRYQSDTPYNGYIASEKFEKYREKYLNI